MASYLIGVDYDEDGHELGIEIYLDYDGPDADTLTPEEVEAVFREIQATGEVPDGWSVESVSWHHGEGPEHEGSEGDLARFGPAIDGSGLSISGDFEGHARGQVDEDEDLEGET